jgi:hypothetical protein
MILCNQCQRPFTPTREGHRFCSDTCRAAWHRNNSCPGKVTGLRALKRGGWAVTVHYPLQPDGITIGSMIRIETADIPRTDAYLGVKTV